MAEVTAENIAEEWFEGFATFWASRTPLFVAGLTFDPDDNAESYARVGLLGRDDGETLRSGTIARQLYQRDASITVEIGVRSGTGWRLAYRLADQAAVWLSNPGLPTAFTLSVGTPVEVGLEGAWFVLTVTAEWRYLTDRP